MSDALRLDYEGVNVRSQVLYYAWDQVLGENVYYQYRNTGESCSMSLVDCSVRIGRNLVYCERRNDLHQT